MSSKTLSGNNPSMPCILRPGTQIPDLVAVDWGKQLQFSGTLSALENLGSVSNPLDSRECFIPDQVPSGENLRLRARHPASAPLVLASTAAHSDCHNTISVLASG